MIEFEWDNRNFKHIVEDYPERGNTVEEVESIFLDPHLIAEKGRTIEGEQRFNALGIGISGAVKFVVYAVNNDIIRPISCWPANKQNIRKYENTKRRKGS